MPTAVAKKSKDLPTTSRKLEKNEEQIENEGMESVEQNEVSDDNDDVSVDQDQEDSSSNESGSESEDHLSEEQEEEDCINYFYMKFFS
jgi:hypothetical protein